MKKAIAIIILLSSMHPIMAQKAKTVTLKFIETSDVHGAFFPYNFTERKAMSGSMARVSTYLKKQRAKFGKNVIVMDNGDILQGQPTNYYTNYVKKDAPNIAAEVVNYLNYDAQVIGNHDIETGHAVFDKWIKELKCPTLGANIIDLKSRQPYVEPYLMLEREGVRIAILGMLTPAIPSWLHESIWSGMRFDEIVASARRWVKVLKEQEQADIIVGLFHSGWDGGISTEDYDEDATQKVAEQVPGFDIIFFGHDHTPHNTTHGSVLCLDPANNAVRVAQATVKVKIDNRVAANSGRPRIEILEKKGELVDITGEDVDRDYIAHFQTQIDNVRAFVERKLGTFQTAIRSRDAFFGPAAFTDYIHQLQLEHTGADVSFNAPLTFNSVIQEGPVYMSDMFKLYRYENKIYVLRMKGDEIRKHLEMSYNLWVNTMTSAGDHIMLLSENTLGDQQRLGFKNFSFNFDSAAGIDYVVDVTKPDGQKVYILQFSDGRPFEPDKWYRVAMNSYRGNGGGELLTKGAGIPLDSIPQRIEYISDYDQRHYLTEKIIRDSVVTPQSLNNWRFIPDAWTQPAIERDRKLLFKE